MIIVPSAQLQEAQKQLLVREEWLKKVERELLSSNNQVGMVVVRICCLTLELVKGNLVVLVGW